MDLKRIGEVVKRLEDVKRLLVIAQHDKEMLEAELRDLVNDTENNELTERLENQTVKSVNTDVFTNLVGGTVRDRIIELFRALPSRSFSVEEIADRTGGALPSVRTLLSVMLKEGQIARHGWGKYGHAANQLEIVAQMASEGKRGPKP
jgi:hypothetical protein